MYLVKFKAFMHMYKTKTDIGVENPDTQKLIFFCIKCTEYGHIRHNFSFSKTMGKKTSCVFIVLKEGSGGGLIDSHPTISTEKVNTTCKTLLFIMFIN